MSITASLSLTEGLIAVAIWIVVLVPAGVTVMKGHVALFVAGFLLVGIVWLVAAPRLAKPNSPWARRFYGPEKLARSRDRYPDIEPSQSSSAPVAAALGFGLIGAAFLIGLVDGLAG